MSAEKDREPIATLHSQRAVPAGGVFLSHASEDAPAADRIATALRTAGIQVWFDKSELRGGDAWDRQIRQQIHDCRLFIAVISAHTEARDEGYFRREWKLAVDRTHDMAEGKAFLVPVVIDSTRERGAAVPEKFRELQWTRLPGGQTPPAFVERVRKLLSPEPSAVRAATTPASPGPNAPKAIISHDRSKLAVWAIGVVLAVGAAYLIADRFWIAKHSPPARATEKATSATSTPPATAAFSPPPHSIAVLPFVNMSGDKDQEYFSEGLTEELLNSLSRINELQVAARTSSFSFQGEHPDIATVAHKLNVGAVLEGSVRRSGHTLRVTTQLVNGVTGFHIWSQTYDRNLGDELQLQSDIATAVASALKVPLLGDEAAKIEVGGTREPAALDAYLRASNRYWTSRNPKDVQAAIDGYAEAIRLDPDYALAYAARSLSLAYLAEDSATPRGEIVTDLQQAEADANKAIALAPTLAEGHLALANLSGQLLEFTRASEEYEHARALGPGNARVLRDAGLFEVRMGRKEAGLAALRRAIALDPLNPHFHSSLALALMIARRYDDAIARLKDALTLRPNDPFFVANIGYAYYLLGDFEAARSNCEPNAEGDDDAQICLAATYEKLGRRADAQAMLAKVRVRNGDSRAVDYAIVYGLWGNTAEALKWLEMATRMRDPWLVDLRMHPAFDPLRSEPRFQAIERALKFPN